MQRGHRSLAGQVHLAGEVHLAAQTRWLSKQGPKNSRLGQAGRSRSGRQAFQGPRPPGQTRLREAVQPLPPSLRPPLSFIAVESLKKKSCTPNSIPACCHTVSGRGGWALICEGSRDVWASSEPGVHSHLIRQTTKCTLMLKNGNET